MSRVHSTPTSTGDSYSAKESARKQCELQAEGAFTPFEQLRPISAAELCKLRIDKPTELWSDLITSGQLGMIFGWRGTGKSSLLMALGLAMASGAEFLGFSAKRPSKVILLDGEMDLHSMKRRLRQIGRSLNVPPTDNFQIMSPELFSGVMPKPTTPEGQSRIDAALGDDWDVLIIDNYSSFSSGREDADAWAPWLPWLLRHKRAGRTVIIVHHTGKNGTQRGASNHEDPMDFVMSLRPPKSRSGKDALEFVVSWTKARHLPPSKTQAFQVTYRQSELGRYVWEKSSNVDVNPKIEEAKVLRNEGKSLEEIATRLEVNKSTISRWLNA